MCKIRITVQARKLSNEHGNNIFTKTDFLKTYTKKCTASQCYKIVNTKNAVMKMKRDIYDTAQFKDWTQDKMSRCTRDTVCTDNIHHCHAAALMIQCISQSKIDYGPLCHPY